MATSTIGTGGQYTTIQSWLASIPADTAGVPYTGELLNQEFIVTAQIAVPSIVTTSAGRITLKCATGASFSDKPYTNSSRYNIANGAGIRCTVNWITSVISCTSADHFYFEGLQFKTAGANSAATVINNASGVDGCIVDSAKGCISFRVTTRSCAIKNCVLFSSSSYSIDVRGGSVENVASIGIGGSTALRVYEVTTVVNNFVNFGFTDDLTSVYGGTAVGSNNASDLGTGIGTAPITNLTDAAFVNAANGDYFPATDGLLDGSGLTIPEITVDIMKQPRSAPYDIGAYQIQGAVVPSISFDGPAVTTINGTQNTALPSPTPDPAMDTRFTVSGGTASYALAPGSSPLPAGVTIDPTTGNLVGTPSEAGTFAGIVVRGTV